MKRTSSTKKTETEAERRRRTALRILEEYPYIYGQQVGFVKLNEINNRWIKEFLYGREDYTLQAHRNSYKTTSVSVALTLHLILNPNITIKFFRKTDAAVKEIIAQVSKMLKHRLTRQLVRDIYGDNINLKLTVDNALEISTNLKNDPRGTSQLSAGGIKSSITGQHYDIIFTDDIITVEDRLSRAERELTKTKYQELINIKNTGDDCRIVNTGTPWHKDDAFSIMPEPERWDVYSTGIIDEDGIDYIRARMVPSLFAANYELRHIAAEDVIFQNPTTGGDVSKIRDAKYLHIDAAYGGEDYTAATICQKINGKYYVLGKLYPKHVDDCLDDILRLKREHLVRTIICEENGDKGYLKKEIIRRKEKATSYWEDTNKYIKIVSYLKAEWPDIIFVEGTDEEYLEQILDYNEYAEHDDAPDSLASIIRKLYNKKDESGSFSDFV
jgi:phage terminase large subunit-like protein